MEDDDRKQLTLNLSKQIETENNSINDSLLNSVEDYKNKNPEKYISFQIQGEFIMNSEYTLQEGVDKEDEILSAKLLLQHYNNGIEDFNPQETLLLEKYYGQDWSKCRD